LKVLLNKGVVLLHLYFFRNTKIGIVAKREKNIVVPSSSERMHFFISNATPKFTTVKFWRKTVFLGLSLPQKCRFQKSFQHTPFLLLFSL